MPFDLWSWAVLISLVVGMLAFNLKIERRRLAAHQTPTLGSTARWSATWIALGLGFSGVVGGLYDRHAAVAYLSAYVLELSLTLDSLLVFSWIFSELRIPARYHQAVLLSGIPATLIVRAVLVTVSLLLIGRFHWVIYPIALLMAAAAVRTLLGKSTGETLVRAACGVGDWWIVRFVPITRGVAEGSFWVRERGRFAVTPLLVALVVIEATDAVFAIDSIPAVLSVTREPFLVYASNVFVMLGLRSLYSILHRAMARLRYLRPALAVTLLLVAARLLLIDLMSVPTWAFVAVIATIVALASVGSLWPRPRRHDIGWSSHVRTDHPG